MTETLPRQQLEWAQNRPLQAQLLRAPGQARVEVCGLTCLLESKPCPHPYYQAEDAYLIAICRRLELSLASWEEVKVRFQPAIDPEEVFEYLTTYPFW